jgi:alpha/beta superfamily hydrolase
MISGPTLERLNLDGPAGKLESLMEDAGSPGGFYAVICHPHPLFGGTMDNKVVSTLAKAMRDVGIPSVRFNFRGVGASAGAFDEGRGETEDADAVANWGAARWPGRQLILAGFSFGAYVALRLAGRRPTSRLITIAPPVQRFDFSGLDAPTCPWLIVQGDADEVVDPRSVIDWVERLARKPQLIVMPGVGHFFHGRLNELRDAVVGAVRGG